MRVKQLDLKILLASPLSHPTCRVLLDVNLINNFWLKWNSLSFGSVLFVNILRERIAIDMVLVSRRVYAQLSGGYGLRCGDGSCSQAGWGVMETRKKKFFCLEPERYADGMGWYGIRLQSMFESWYFSFWRRLNYISPHRESCLFITWLWLLFFIDDFIFLEHFSKIAAFVSNDIIYTCKLNWTWINHAASGLGSLRAIKSETRDEGVIVQSLGLIVEIARSPRDSGSGVAFGRMSHDFRIT